MVKRGPCVRPQASEGEARMEHFAGLDVSVKDTNVCIVDDTGKIVREVKVASEPEALLAVLTNPAYHFKRIGLEAGPLSNDAAVVIILFAQKRGEVRAARSNWDEPLRVKLRLDLG